MNWKNPIEVKEYFKQYNARYHSQNRARINSAKKSRRSQNKEQYLTECRKYYADNLERRREVARSYYHRNRDRVLEREKTESYRSTKRAWNNKAENKAKRALYNKLSREKNKDLFIERSKADWIKHKSKRSVAHRKYYENNKELFKKLRRRWAKNNPGKMQSYVQRYKARKLAAFQDGSADAFYTYVRSLPLVGCYYCGTKVPGKEAHVDHVIAVSRHGNHASSNLAATCQKCNQRKGSKLPSDLHFTNQPLLNL